MLHKFLFVLAVLCTASAYAQTYRYHFSGTPVANALTTLSQEHPEISISFIYDELEAYSTDAEISTDDPFYALRLIAARNPIFVTRNGNHYFCEAMQQGIYRYSGKITDPEGEPVISANILVLAPADSTVLTFGTSDSQGVFSIPCDRNGIILKISSLGFRTLYVSDPPFNCGTIFLAQKPLNLKAVNVEADAATLEQDKSVFLPSQRQKNASVTAIDLLRHMAIPLIKVNPSNDAVSDNYGTFVPIFINSIQASGDELSGINIADVLRVEILEFPTDPRFKNVPKAINLIVREYVYGGFTKLYLSEKYLTGFSNYSSVFSKFSFKRMTYDLFLASDNSTTTYLGADSESRFTLGYPSEEYTVTRTEKIEAAKEVNNQFPITFRASYNADKIQLRNTASFTYWETPQSWEEGTLCYSYDHNSTVHYRNSSPCRSNSVSYSGNWIFSLPADFSVNFEPSFVYTHRNNFTKKKGSGSPDINRHAKENAISYRTDLYISRHFNQYHTINLEAMYANTVNRIRYSGSYSATDRFENPFAATGLTYNYNRNKVYVSVDMGMAWEWIDINNRRSSDAYPYTHIFTRYTPDSRHSLQTYIQYASNSPGISMRSNDILKENDILYITGNPELKNSRHLTLQAGYTWLPSNSVNLSFFGRYFGVYDRSFFSFKPYLNGSALIRTFVNKGDFNSIETGANANIKILGNALQFFAGYTRQFHISTGSLPDHLYRGILWLQATCYVKSGYIEAYYTSPSASLSMLSNTIISTPAQDGITVGWGNNKVKLNLTAANMFNSGNRGQNARMISSLYSNNMILHDGSGHPYINFSVAFTLGYGRKVSRDNEIGIQSSATSGILKY